MIAINGKIFTQRMSGLGRFAFEVVKKMIDADVGLIIFTPNKSLHHDYKALEKFVIRDTSFLPPFLWELFRLGQLVQSSKFGALWSPANIGPLNPRVSHFLTLHDLTFIHDPTWMHFKGRLIYKIFIPLICKKARAVVADCNFIRQELINYMPYKRSVDIHMSFLGADHVSVNEVKFNRFELPKMYFVFLGNIDKRKNLDKIIQAWKIAYDKSGLEIRLLIIGASKSRERYRLNLSHQSIDLFDAIPDEELYFLLSKSRGLIFPSLYEGFGLPILEAMRCGCPVITSNIGAMAEVAGDAAIIVNPYSVNDIADAICKLSDSDILRSDLIKKGLERQQRFVWDKTAKFYTDLFLTMKNS
jgi:glycosyltransferase involved in cell wall biosynthesis